MLKIICKNIKNNIKNKDFRKFLNKNLTETKNAIKGFLVE